MITKPYKTTEYKQDINTLIKKIQKLMFEILPSGRMKQAYTKKKKAERKKKGRTFLFGFVSFLVAYKIPPPMEKKKRKESP